MTITITVNQYNDQARRMDLLGDVSTWSEYDPDIGKVPEHFVPKYLHFVNALVAAVVTPVVAQYTIETRLCGASPVPRYRVILWFGRTFYEGTKTYAREADAIRAAEATGATPR